MATLDKTIGTGVKPWMGMNKCYIMENIIDLAGVATGDVVQALAIGAKTLVMGVYTEVVTASNKVSTATVGDGAAAAAWDASIDLAATAGTMTGPSAALSEGTPNTYADANAPGGKLYSAADTVDLTCTVTAGPIGSGKIRVMALCVDLA